MGLHRLFTVGSDEVRLDHRRGTRRWGRRRSTCDISEGFIRPSDRLRLLMTALDGEALTLHSGWRKTYEVRTAIINFGSMSDGSPKSKLRVPEKGVTIDPFQYWEEFFRIVNLPSVGSQSGSELNLISPDSWLRRLRVNGSSMGKAAD
jgi:hypothetical protein